MSASDQHLYGEEHGPIMTVYVAEDEKKAGMRGMSVVRVQLLFFFEYNGTVYLCALVEWFQKVGRSPNANTGMWKVKPTNHCRVTSVLHLDMLLCRTHLLPAFDISNGPLSLDFHYYYSLDAFEAFFVNKFIDHHANEIAF